MDICSLGEMVIDLTPIGKSACGNIIYEQNAGGAPANVACGAAKLKAEAAFITMLSRDNFGKVLNETLIKHGVCTDGVRFCDERTGLAVICLSESGDRNFNFYRSPCADQMLSKEAINTELLDCCEVLHFSSVSLTHNTSREATLFALQYAKRNKKLISFDINYRELLSEDIVTYQKSIRDIIPLVDILKASEEEAKLFSGQKSVEDAAAYYRSLNIPMVVITLGARGCYCICNKYSGYVPTYDIKTVDTTGAGDNFVAALLVKLLSFGRQINSFEADNIQYLLEYANAAGSICASRYGTIYAMASENEIINCMNNIKKLLL